MVKQSKTFTPQAKTLENLKIYWHEISFYRISYRNNCLFVTTSLLSEVSLPLFGTVGVASSSGLFLQISVFE